MNGVNMRKFLVLLLCLGLYGCVTVITHDSYIKTSDIQKVSIGDSFKEVVAKIGQSNQILSKKMSTDGKGQIIWLYEVIAHEKCKTGIFDIACPDALTMEQEYQMQLVDNPPYLVIFTDGKVSNIERQKIDTTINTVGKIDHKKVKKKKKLF